MAALDAWLYNRVRNDSELRARAFPQYLVGRGHWYDPESVILAFTPTSDSWMSSAWVSFHGALEPHGPRRWPRSNATGMRGGAPRSPRRGGRCFSLSLQGSPDQEQKLSRSRNSIAR